MAQDEAPIVDLDDEKEVELFNGIIQLPVDRRKRLLDAVDTYILIMSEGAQILPKEEP